MIFLIHTGSKTSAGLVPPPCAIALQLPGLRLPVHCCLAAVVATALFTIGTAFIEPHHGIWRSAVTRA